MHRYRSDHNDQFLRFKLSHFYSFLNDSAVSDILQAWADSLYSGNVWTLGGKNEDFKSKGTVRNVLIWLMESHGLFFYFFHVVDCEHSKAHSKALKEQFLNNCFYTPT